MTAKDKVENIMRNAWLAGLGTIESQREALVESLDKAQEKSEELYNKLIDRGEEVQDMLDEKFDEKTQEIKNKGKKYFNCPSEDITKEQDEQLDKLFGIIDKLTDKATLIAEKRLQDIQEKTVAVEKAKETAKKINAARPEVKATTNPVAKTATNPVAKTATKPVAKTATKPVAKTATNPVAKTATNPVAKTATKPVAKTVTKPVAKTTGRARRSK